MNPRRRSVSRRASAATAALLIALLAVTLSACSSGDGSSTPILDQCDPPGVDSATSVPVNLDAAAAQGVKSAHAIMVRLPGEVREIFREWLLRHFPDRVRHVMSLVRDVRGGKDNDPNFGSRFVGEGPFALLMQQRLEKARERHGLNQVQPPLRTDLFIPPRLESAQLDLF